MADSVELKSGDVVQLNSGGPNMTVQRVSEDQHIQLRAVVCVWFENNHKHQDTFKHNNLKKVSVD